MVLDPNFIAGALGVLMSLLLEYFPGLKTWYEGLEKGYKALLALGLSVVIGLVIFGLNCAGWWAGKVPAIVCSYAGIQELVWMILVAWFASQSTYLTVRYVGKGK